MSGGGEGVSGGRAAGEGVGDGVGGGIGEAVAAPGRRKALVDKGMTLRSEAPQLALSSLSGNCRTSDSFHFLDSLSDVLGDFKNFNRRANRLADALAQGDD